MLTHKDCTVAMIFRLAMPERAVRRRRSLILLIAPLLLTAPQAHAALIGDVLKPYASTSEMYDSNVFRVKDSAQLAALIGDTQMSDLATIIELGTAVHYELSQQALDLNLKRDFIRYNHYTQENVDRDDINGRLSLRFLDHLRGAVDGAYNRTPEPRADFHSPELNVRTTTNMGGSVAYDMPSGVSFEGGYHRQGTDYSLAQYRPNEYDTDVYTGTVSYRLSPEAQVYARYQHEVRTYREGEPVGEGTVKRDNSADSIRFGASKSFSRSEVSGDVGAVNRRYKDFSDRDFSGVIGKAQMKYQVTAKTAVVVGGERDLYEETYANRAYSVNNSLSVGAVYQATEKIKATAGERVIWKKFEAMPGTDAPKRSDLVQEFNAGVEWTPIKRLTAGVNYQFSTRNSDEAQNKYNDHTVSASIAYKF